MRNFLTTGFGPGALPIRSTLPNSRKWEDSNLHAAFATTLLSKEGQYQLWDISKEWGREESNLRRAGLQPAALPTELQPHINSFKRSDGFGPPVSGLQPLALPGLAKSAYHYPEDRTRTCTPFRAPAPKAGASTIPPPRGIELAGLEPTTSRLKILRATNCTTAQ